MMVRHLMTCQINIVLQIHSDWFGCECSPRTCKTTERTLIINGGEKISQGTVFTKAPEGSRLCIMHSPNAGCGHWHLFSVLALGREEVKKVPPLLPLYAKMHRHSGTDSWERRKEKLPLSFKFCLTLVSNFLLFCHEVTKCGLISENAFLSILSFSQSYMLEQVIVRGKE